MKEDSKLSIGFGFGMMERYGGLPISTSDNWLEGLPNTDNECLKLPSGNTCRVSRILGLDNNLYVVVEVSLMARQYLRWLA